MQYVHEYDDSTLANLHHQEVVDSNN
jgi:hypothetical protein